MPALRDTEELFWKLISAPEGVADGLRRIDMKSEELARMVAGDARLDAVQRLDIYANMYFWRLLDILRGDYSSVAAAVGDDHFHNLVTDYLVACPSAHPSVRNVGVKLPGYLKTHALGIERPWLVELARLERARVELFDGPDGEPLTLDELRERAPESFVSLPLPLIPSHLFLDVGHAVDDVLRAAENEEAIEPPAAGARTLLIWRQDGTVFHRPLESLEH
ncbi:MAG TPA: DNA-binding domain-containing protein, partial [Polyangia bacterium]